MDDLPVFNELAEVIVLQWLKEQRKLAMHGAQRPLDTEDCLKTVTAIDGVLRYIMTADEFREWSNHMPD